MKVNKTYAAIFAACLLLAVMVPAVAAAAYPHNGQFMGYYERNAISTTSKATTAGGYTYVNTAATMSRVTPLATPSSTDWPQFFYNAAHTGYSPSTGLPSSNSSVWSKNFTAIGTTNPIVSNGKIFLLTGYAGFDEPDGLTTINLTCLNASNPSQILWNFTLPRTIHWGSWASPATDGTYVYVSSDNKHYAINVTTGQAAWSFTGFSYIENGGPSTSDTMVFLSDSGDYSSSTNGTYYGLFKNNGTLRWTFNYTNANPAFKYSQASPAYDSSDNSVYVTGYDSNYDEGYLYKLNATTGSEIWYTESNSGEIFGGSASVDSTKVYVTSYNFDGGNGNVYAYYKNNGTLAWSQPIEPSDATPSIANGIVYVSGGTAGFTQHGVYAFNASTGSVVWHLDGADGTNPNDIGGWTDSPSVANGYVFVGHETDNSSYPDYCYNAIYALNATTGATVWYYPQGGATAAIANSQVYTIGNNGYLYRFG